MSYNYTGARIRWLRLKRGYTQAEVARKIGVSSGTMSRWERGEQHPREDSRERLEELIGPRDEAELLAEEKWLIEGMTWEKYSKMSPDDQDDYLDRVNRAEVDKTVKDIFRQIDDYNKKHA